MAWTKKGYLPSLFKIQQNTYKVCKLAPKGYVPVILGRENEQKEKIIVHVSILNHPFIRILLDHVAADQDIGYKQNGVLSIPCDVLVFLQVLKMISETNKASWFSSFFCFNFSMAVRIARPKKLDL
ncbi:hypothetical protein IEQ34_016551 [Dendrobium chrysotoxum]|uniref:Small auxin up regulated protein n=1 Tax=Dendrobium chrysotoxum TaxID=161865 RepID=A0AAV7GFN3_DENCH|nr:hypothetical protein IEQ34_016551 [Dendrobium chrysotoxum]